MKNITTLSVRITTGAVGLAFICLAGGAFAQGERAETTRIGPPPSKSASPAASAAAATGKAAATKGALSSQDSQFVNNAAKGGMMEVAGGKEAAKHAQNADVKQFGNRMVTDHSAANNELKGIASRKGIKLPAGQSAPKWTSDKAYMDMMVQDHQKDLAEFKTEASKGTDPELKAFAGKTSKVIAEHLKMAKQIDGKLK